MLVFLWPTELIMSLKKTSHMPDEIPASVSKLAHINGTAAISGLAIETTDGERKLRLDNKVASC